MTRVQTASAKDYQAHRGQSSVLSVLACPACFRAGSVIATASTLECVQCGTAFPLVQNGATTIPWLLPDPANAMLEWQTRFRGFLHVNSLEQKRLRRALADTSPVSGQQRRIQDLLAARKAHRAQITQLLAPLGLNPGGSEPSSTDRLGSKLPKNQGLLSYHDNIFRDWAWNNGENEIQLGALQRVMQADKRERLGSALTLGSGACRLAYDVHQHHSVDVSVAVDINPVLLLLASRVIHGEAVPLYEFPLAPLNSSSFAVLRNCQAPQSIQGSGQQAFLCVFADAMNPPFEAGSFDTLLTPWLLDIIPQDLSEFIPRVNQLLAPGGVWLNTGSLAFFHEDERWRYSEDELLALVGDCGFEILSVNRSEIPYLQSPASATGRVETILSFSARKVCDTPVPPRFEYLPLWLRDSTAPVPSTTDLALASSNHLLQAQVFASIDGQRTVQDIGRLLAKQYGLAIPEAVAAAKHILVSAYEGSAHSDG